MSAPPGYNPSSTMLPETGGAIRAMQGGFSASPYTGGVTETNSLIKDVSSAIAPISSYSGGAANAIPIAIASTVANTNSVIMPPVASSVVAPISAPIATPVEPIAVSIAEAASAAPQSSSSVSVPIEILNANPSAKVAIATVAALAQNNANANSNIQSNANSNIQSINGIAGENVGRMKNVEVDLNSEKSQKIVNNSANKIITAISIVAANSEKDKDVETKKIIVYGKEYNVPNPLDRKKNEDNWKYLPSV